MVTSKDHEAEKSVDAMTSKVLDKELGQLTNLREILSRSSQVASSMETILDSFDHRLARLEMTILPVYQQTGNLQRRQQNTDKTLQALDYVIGFYNVAGEYEGVIRERPGSIGVATYLAAMDKLMAARKFFQTNNPEASELENVKSLFERGCQQLSIEFRDELKKYQKPLAPHVTLELIDLDEADLNEEILSSVDLIPVAVREDLRSIASWLDKNGTADRLTVYAKQRAYVLSESLKALRAFQRSSSGERGPTHAISAGASLNSPALSRSRGLKLDVARLRSAKISQKATRVLLRAMPVQTASRRQGAPSQAEEALDENDVAIYLNQVSALHRLSYCELILARQLVPQDKVTRTFELIIKDPIHDLAVEGNNLASQAQRSVNKGDIQAVLSLLALLKHMTVMQHQYQLLLASCQHSFQAKFSDIVHTLQNTTNNALEGFVSSLRSEGERALPKDGTVHELTSNALVFVEQLLDFTSTLAPILQEEGVAKKSNAKLCLGFYIKRVLSYLGCALVNRSSSFSDSTLCAIFLLNNYNYILKSLRNSDLLSIVTLAEPECSRNYKDLILQQKKMYSDSLKKLAQYLDTSDDILLSTLNAGGKLRDKEKQLIKDRFSSFNKEIEEMQKVQRGYSIPDLELRESIKRDNKEYILPKYQAFYDKFCQVHFSKTPEKYIKYTPVDISHKLDEFFDVAA